MPKYLELYTPLLTFLIDGTEHIRKEIHDSLAQTLQLSEELLAERLPSGKQTVYSNRPSWALTFLKKATLLDSPRRGFYFITDKG